MEVRELKPGDVVQLSPDSGFPGCFMIVTERKSFGAQGFIAIPERLGEIGSKAHYRATWPQMEFIGPAAFVPAYVSLGA